VETNCTKDWYIIVEVGGCCHSRSGKKRRCRIGVRWLWIEKYRREMLSRQNSQICSTKRRGVKKSRMHGETENLGSLFSKTI